MIALNTKTADIEPFIETYGGKKVWFLDPKPEMFDIKDIAHALSMQCRYTGHTRSFYSVAEHSVHVSFLTGTLEGLLHDASEAYLTDIASPIKPHLANYKHLESGIMSVIAEKYGFDWPPSDDLHDADKAQLKTEARHLMPSKGKDWLHMFPTERRHGRVPECWDPTTASIQFLKRYHELTDV